MANTYYSPAIEKRQRLFDESPDSLYCRSTTSALELSEWARKFLARRQLFHNQDIQEEAKLNQTMAAEMTLSSEDAISAMMGKLPQAY